MRSVKAGCAVPASFLTLLSSVLENFWCPKLYSFLGHLFQSFANHTIKKEVLFFFVCLCKSTSSFMGTVSKSIFLHHSSLSVIYSSYLVLAKTHTQYWKVFSGGIFRTFQGFTVSFQLSSSVLQEGWWSSFKQVNSVRKWSSLRGHLPSKHLGVPASWQPGMPANEFQVLTLGSDASWPLKWPKGAKISSG